MCPLMILKISYPVPQKWLQLTCATMQLTGLHASVTETTNDNNNNNANTMHSDTYDNSTTAVSV